MKYSHYDENQNLLGWYDDLINPTIPEPVIEVSFNDWLKAINTNANYVDLINKKVIVKDNRPDEEILIEEKNKKIKFYNKQIIRTHQIENDIFYNHRDDILKYKEANDAQKACGLNTVKLNLPSGHKEFDVDYIDEVIIILVKQAYDNYWLEKEYENAVNSCTTLEELNALKEK